MAGGIPVAATVHIGCCGWSYLEEREFAAQIKRKYSTKLQAYAQLFDAVEINSTFYRLPRVSTAQKWRDEAGAVNSKFEFTVKAYQGITHIHRFMGGVDITVHSAERNLPDAQDICCALPISRKLPTDRCFAESDEVLFQ